MVELSLVLIFIVVFVCAMTAFGESDLFHDRPVTVVLALCVAGLSVLGLMGLGQETKPRPSSPSITILIPYVVTALSLIGFLIFVALYKAGCHVSKFLERWRFKHKKRAWYKAQTRTLKSEKEKKKSEIEAPHWSERPDIEEQER